DLLQIIKNKMTISLHELEKLILKVCSYQSFATLNLSLENDCVLQMIKSQGRNHHTPPLAYKYRIQRHALNRTYHQELQSYRLKFHDAINLDAYLERLEEREQLELF